MSKHELIKDIITGLENKYPVEKWRLHGVDIWPNLRFKLYFHLLNTTKDTKFESDFSSKKVIAKKNNFQFKRVLNLVNDLLYFVLFSVNARDATYVFAGLSMHRVRDKGKMVNKFFDPIIDRYNLKSTVVHFELDKLKDAVYNDSCSYELSPLLKGFFILLKIKKIFLKSNDSVNSDCVEQYDEFYNDISTEKWFNTGLDVSLQNWSRWSLKVHEKQLFFDKIFKKWNPKGVMIASYYGFEDTAAMIIAAKNNNIPIADFQHGPQTGFHMAYSLWTKIPDRGYNTMPTHYWCWDEISADNICKSNNLGLSKALGNTWLQQQYELLQHKERTHILYTLQVLRRSNLTYFFNTNILNTIKASEFLWVLRLHPRTVLDKKDLTVFLNEAGISTSNYVIELAQESSLVQSLAQAIAHVTNFSGSLIEATLLNVPTIVIDIDGTYFYECYLEQHSINLFLDKNNDNFFIEFQSFISKRAVEIKIELGEVAHPKQLFNNF
jgi:hypothetical protein